MLFKYDVPISYFWRLSDIAPATSRIFSYSEVVEDLQDGCSDNLSHARHPSLFTSCIFQNNLRSAGAKTRSGLVVLDVDGKLRLEDARAAMTDLAVSGFIYTGASHAADDPQFRIAIPLASIVDAHVYRHVWQAMNRAFGGVADPSSGGPGAMFRVPGRLLGRKPTFMLFDGDVMPAEFWVQRFSSRGKGAFCNGGADSMKEPGMQRGEFSASQGGPETEVALHDPRFMPKRARQAYLDALGDWGDARFGFMSSIAARALRQGVRLTPEQLRNLFNEEDRIQGQWHWSPDHQHDLLDEAERAIAGLGAG